MSASVDSPTWHIAQVNVAKMRAPLDDPVMAGFVERLEAVNAAADRAPGFVWRFQTDEGDATAVRAYDDESLLFNLSVWESIEALRNYVYGGVHLEPLRMRAHWFELPAEPHLALWWVPAGTVPTVDEAVERLELLRGHGPSERAFSMKSPFAPPS